MEPYVIPDSLAFSGFNFGGNEYGLSMLQPLDITPDPQARMVDDIDAYADMNLEQIFHHFNKVTNKLQDKIEKRYTDSLESERKGLRVTSDRDLFKRFDKLSGELDFDEDNVAGVYRVTRDLIADIDNTREWLKKYNNYLKRHKNEDTPEIKHEKLINLGKAILARAVELCPTVNGNLRRSGTLIDSGSYIVILFTAPYATYVHENMNSRHPIGRAKFLELALQEFMPDRKVWIEMHGQNAVYARITRGGKLTYRHYD